MSKKNTNRPYQLLTYLGTKTLGLAFFLILLGLGLQGYSKSYLDKICTDSNEKLECILHPYAKEMSTSLVTSAITILALEILFKRESIREIEKIFNATEATRSIKAFYPRLDLYEGLIIDDIKQAPKSQEIKILGLASLELEILSGISKNKLIEKICLEDCNLRVILLHPDSDLRKCIENLGYRRSKAQINGGVHEVFEDFFIDLYSYINTNKLSIEKISGKIEVRTHKNIFSPVFYYSGSKLNIVGLYFSLGKNTEHPAFDILDPSMKKELDSHFEEIWSKSSGGTILRWNGGKDNSDIYKVMEVFPDIVTSSNTNPSK